jgi:hypothetical protein
MAQVAMATVFDKVLAVEINPKLVEVRQLLFMCVCTRLSCVISLGHTC